MQIQIWRRYLNWEKANPLRTDDQSIVVKRGGPCSTGGWVGGWGWFPLDQLLFVQEHLVVFFQCYMPITSVCCALVSVRIFGMMLSLISRECVKHTLVSE